MVSDTESGEDSVTILTGVVLFLIDIEIRSVSTLGPQDKVFYWTLQLAYATKL